MDMRDTIRELTMDPYARVQFHLAYLSEVGVDTIWEFGQLLGGFDRVHALARRSCRARSSLGHSDDPQKAIRDLVAMAHEDYTPIWAGRLK